MIETYFPVLLAFLVAAAMAAILFSLNRILSPHHPNPIKGEPYECGIPSEGSTGDRVDVRFFLTAVLFLLFDVEIVFFFPWAVVFRDFVNQGAGRFVLLEMGFFLAVLLVGFAYIWRKGALEWE